MEKNLFAYDFDVPLQALLKSVITAMEMTAIKKKVCFK
jgi:hypothetical protein